MSEHSVTGKYRLGIDLGGTKILAAVVDDTGRIVGKSKNATLPDLGPEGVIERIIKTANAAIEKSGVPRKAMLAAGVGAPAPVDTDRGIVYDPPNLPGWPAVPLADKLQAGLGFPVFVDNDVNVGTYGEYVLGAGQGARDMVGVFVGTGIGGGVVVDGKLRRGFRFSAGELGHMTILPNGPLCGCGRRGCVEALASRTAIEREVRAGLDAGRDSVVGELLAKSKRGRLTSGIIRKALARDDDLMKEVIGQAQFYLGLMVANIVNFFDPELFVFGGGVVEALGDDFLGPIHQVALAYFKQQLDAERVRIAPAVLGDYAGVLGAAMLAGEASVEGRNPPA